MTARYAIYYAPDRGSALAHFGNALIGWDAESGADIPFHPSLASFPLWQDWTEEPRRYGLHATLKAPFELASSYGEEDLLAAVDAFATRRPAFMLPSLKVMPLGSFVALVPEADPAELSELAEACVRVLERFRAPMREEDRLRRLSQTLTERQRSQLDAFGYPYIFRDFRFHITLTGTLPASQIDEVRARLAELYEPLRTSLYVRDIAVFRQGSRQARFQLIHRSPLEG